jgi:hypothetical protein
MKNAFDRMSKGASEPTFFMGVCEICGDHDHVTHNDIGQTVCGWCLDHKVIGAWKNKRLVRAIKKGEQHDGRA